MTPNPPETDNKTSKSLEEAPKPEYGKDAEGEEVIIQKENTAQTINDNSQQPSPQE